MLAQAFPPLRTYSINDTKYFQENFVSKAYKLYATKCQKLFLLIYKVNCFFLAVHFTLKNKQIPRLIMELIVFLDYGGLMFLSPGVALSGRMQSCIHFELITSVATLQFLYFDKYPASHQLLDNAVSQFRQTLLSITQSMYVKYFLEAVQCPG